MMMPSILGENLFDDFMNDFRLPAFPDVDKELYGKHAKNLMKTDVKETEKGYEVDMDLPGFKKDEIQMTAYLPSVQPKDWTKMRKTRKVTTSEKSVMQAA